MTQFPAPNSGQAPPVQVPGMRFVGYGPDGQPQYASDNQPPPPLGNSLPPGYAPPPGYPAAPFAAPLVAPPPGYDPNPPLPGYPTPGALYVPTVGGYAPPGAGGTITFGESAWQGYLPEGQFVVVLDNIEAGVSQQKNEKLTFHATTIQPVGDVPAGRKHLWDYALTEKAIGKLGRDVVNAGIDGNKHYPRDARGMAAMLLQELRGVQLVIKVVQRKDDPERTNTSIVQRYGAASLPTGVTQVPTTPPPAPAQAAPPLPVAPPAAVPAPGGPPSGGAPQYPQAPPPGSSFGKV